MKSFFSLVAIVLIVSCQKTETDFVGTGDIIIENESQSDIVVIFAESNETSRKIDTSKTIESKTIDTIWDVSLSNTPVYPSTALTSFKVYELSFDTLELLYDQDPIDNSKWIIKKKDSGAFAYTSCIFKFTDSMHVR